MAEKKEKRYVSDNARLMEEWDWEKNTDFDPSALTLGSNKKVWWRCSKGHQWEAIIHHRVEGTKCPFCSGKHPIKGETDLGTLNPELAQEWCHERNNGLTPADVLPNSNKKVWWKCKNGHAWQAGINNRSNGHGCPYCAGLYAINSETDLNTINPILSKEWNYGKNGQLTPADFTANSGKKVWWTCRHGHEWEATISSRNRGNGCPYCSSRKVLAGYNDLQTVCLYLAKEWNLEKNGTLRPNHFAANSNKKVWWICEKGHEWQATIANRYNGRGCPICTSEQRTSFPEYAIFYYLNRYGLKALHSYKDLGYELDIFIPSKKIAIEYDGFYWHTNKVKQDLKKNQMCKKDGIKLFRIREGLPSLNDTSTDYLVKRNQENLSAVLSIILRDIIGEFIDVDLNRDLFSIESLREHMERSDSFLISNPQVAQEWHYEKNGTLTPGNFTANSGKKVWWVCNLGHEWMATIASRNRGTGCPYCAGQKVLVGYNDLKTVNPALAKEWNYIKNGNLVPENFTANSGKKVWWICINGHEWQTRISHRNNGIGCPECSKQKRKKKNT